MPIIIYNGGIRHLRPSWNYAAGIGSRLGGVSSGGISSPTYWGRRQFFVSLNCWLCDFLAGFVLFNLVFFEIFLG